MTQWWQCPRCGTRLRITMTKASCPRGDWAADLPVPTGGKDADDENTTGRF